MWDKIVVCSSVVYMAGAANTLNFLSIIGTTAGPSILLAAPYIPYAVSGYALYSILS